MASKTIGKYQTKVSSQPSSVSWKRTWNQKTQPLPMEKKKKKAGGGFGNSSQVGS